MLLLIIAAGVYFISSLENPAQKKKVVQQVTVVKPPPPPPEPPPEEEIEEEVEEQIEEEIPDDPEPLPDQPSDQPPGENLGLDAEGVAGGDSFGLAARKGGRGLLSGGGYGAYLKNQLNKAVLNDEELKYLDYVAIVSIRLGADGGFETVDVELEEGSDRARERLQYLFANMGGLDRAVPFEERDKTFRLRISSVL